MPRSLTRIEQRSGVVVTGKGGSGAGSGGGVHDGSVGSDGSVVRAATGGVGTGATGGRAGALHAMTVNKTNRMASVALTSRRTSTG